MGLGATQMCQNIPAFSLFDQVIGRTTVPKLMNNGPKSAQWRVAPSSWDQKRLIGDESATTVVHYRLIGPKSVTNSD